MTTDIQLLRSSVANKRPTPTNLLDGQPAVNMNSQSPGLFFKMTDGNLAKVGPATITTDGSAPNSAPQGALGNAVAEEWIDARTVFSSPILKLYQSDVLGWKAAHGFEVDDTTGDQALDRKLTLRTMVATGTGADSYIQVPSGPASDQLTIGSAGMIRLETDDDFLNYHDGTQWQALLNRGGDGLFSSLTVTGNTTLGDDCSDLLNIVATTTVACDLTMLSTGIFFEAAGSGSNKIGFQAPPVLSDALTVFTLPNGDGLAQQVLQTDGSGQLGWVTRTAVPSGAANDTEVFFDDNDVIKGTPLLRINKNTPSISVNADIIPDSDSVTNLGSQTNRFANIYTGDLHLKNERGDWTVIEEEDYLSLRNNSTGKTFRLVMEEVS